MLTPWIGFCGTPFSIEGALMPVASRIVGVMSMTWWNWLRSPPLSLMRAGQDMTMPLWVPPKCEAICLNHWKGVLSARAQPTG